jgi:DNA-directed RNA polymerase specialized sigma24 family protein
MDRTTGDRKWAELSAGIKNGDEGAMATFYRVFRLIAYAFDARNAVPDDIGDHVDDAFTMVVEAVQDGRIRDTKALLAYGRRALLKKKFVLLPAAARNEKEVCCSEGHPASPFLRELRQQVELRRRKQVGVMPRVLREMPSRDREAITRFYVRGENVEQICAEMGVTEVEFRLLKRRAKAHFGELCRTENASES